MLKCSDLIDELKSNMEVRMSKVSVFLLWSLGALAFVGCSHRLSPKSGNIQNLNALNAAIPACSQTFVDSYTATTAMLSQTSTQESSIGAGNAQCSAFLALNEDKCQVDCNQLSGQAKSDYCPAKNHNLITALDLVVTCSHYISTHSPDSSSSKTGPE